MYFTKAVNASERIRTIINIIENLLKGIIMINFTSKKNKKILVVVISIMIIAMVAPLVLSSVLGIL